MKNEFTALICKIFNKNRELGLIHVSTEDEILDGRTVTVKGNPMVYFGNCSYMGLETDERIKAAAIEAVKRYGSQFSCSRTFLQMGLYEQAESLLSQIFERPTLLAPTTSLAHISVIPVLVSERDAIIVDAQAHNSMRNAIQMVKGDGIYVETLPHSRMDKLETRIQILQQSYEKVWFFMDGVYSMYGDLPPFGDIKLLLDRYEQLHCYVDDAHGMSWTGKHGRGVTLGSINHSRLMVVTSLAKGFANCGGAIVCKDEEQKMLIKNCGSSFIFSGPLQPAVLGAVVETAKIHLTDEINTLQNSLFEKMLFFVEYAKSLNVPVISHALTPIFYVGVGKPEVGFKLSKYFANEGLLCNLAQFPAVSVNNAGMRITITNHHTLEDIRHLLNSFHKMLPVYLKQDNLSYEDVYAAFGISPQNQSLQSDKKKAA